MNRREFVQLSAAAVAGTAILGSSRIVRAAEPPIRLKKAVKLSMSIPGAEEGKKASASTVMERMQLIADCGFQGCEFQSPNEEDAVEVRDAAKKLGIKVHGVIDSVHWNKRFSSPDKAILEEAHQALKKAIADCKTVGGSTVLVVPASLRKDKDGSTDGTYQEAWDRSIAEIKRCVPDAKAAGVKIAVETVWNEFITTPKQFVDYIDAFNDPTVGGYFDISNMLKYGVTSADWIRQTGKRLLKVDCKGYNIEKGAWVDIGSGSENWPEVLKALAEVHYPGEFLTAEVRGGGRERLMEISKQMDGVLQLT
jgi:L-ribulose-5-phosphate 3-epimerase